MKKTDFDIAVIGLGPAGATFARLISDKYSVIAIDEKSEAPDSFKKPCGGLLSLDAQKAMAMFDMTLPKDILVDPQIFSVKTIDVNSRLVRHYQRFYINLDRHKFDLWLKSLIPENVSVVTGRCLSVAGNNDRYTVQYKLDGNITETITAKYIVGADGAKSIVRNTFYPHKRFRKYVAVQQWFEDVHINPFYSCIFDEKTSDCYSWSVSKDKYFIFGGAFPYNSCRKSFEIQKEKLEKFDFKFGEPLKTEACLVMRPENPLNFCTGSNNIFLIGEAAGFVSPSSLEGISYAILSAKKLNDAFNASGQDKNKLYRKKVLPIKLKLIGKLLKCPFMYNPLLRRFVMKSKLNSINVQK